MKKLKKLIKKIWIYIRPFLSWKFLISYSIPWMIVNGWAWIGLILMPIIGPNWFTIAASSWMAFLWMPWNVENLVTVPCAIWIHTRIFKNDKKTHYLLLRMYAEARKDWKKVKEGVKKLWKKENKKQK